MSRCRTPALAILRRSRDALVLAVLALVLNVLATTAHLAMQATDFGGARVELESIGLLTLCHESDEALPGDGQTPPHRVPAPCTICQTVQAAGAGIIPVALSLADPISEIAGPVAAPPRSPAIARAPIRFGVNRGPPSVLPA